MTTVRARKSTLIRIALVGALALLSCDSPVESQMEQQLWTALDIRNYEYVYSVSCFCGFSGPNPAKLTVRNGVVVKVEPTGTAVLPPTTPVAATYPTVDSLFAIVDRARRANPASFVVEYDDTYHFPKLISIDPVQGTADDEASYRAESFIPGLSAGSVR